MYLTTALMACLLLGQAAGGGSSRVAPVPALPKMAPPVVLPEPKMPSFPGTPAPRTDLAPAEPSSVPKAPGEIEDSDRQPVRSAAVAPRDAGPDGRGPLPASRGRGDGGQSAPSGPGDLPCQGPQPAGGRDPCLLAVDASGRPISHLFRGRAAAQSAPGEGGGGDHSGDGPGSGEGLAPGGQGCRVGGPVRPGCRSPAFSRHPSSAGGQPAPCRPLPHLVQRDRFPLSDPAGRRALEPHAAR